MTYRDPLPDRLYVCAGCGAAERAPLTGGQVACSRCRTSAVLPDRTALPVTPGPFQVPALDAARLQHLRAQDGRPKQVPPTLQAVLGGASIQIGREQESLAIWQSLRARALQGDVAASEDMVILTLLLVQSPSVDAQLGDALRESAFDAGVLPRHKQEQLGALVRRAAGRGDRARATTYLGWMVPNATELDMESEARVAGAFVATLDGDAARVLALLGPKKDEIPIQDALDPLASLLRANAYERLGDLATAAQVLRELPAPSMLDRVRAAFPALQLCARSGPVYSAAATQEAATRAASGASNIGRLLGGSLAFTGLMLLPFAFGSDVPMVIPVLGIGLIGGGVAIAVRAHSKGQRAAWLRTNGVSLTAQVVSAQPTGTTINNVPMYRFQIRVAGPSGPYPASFERLAHEHQVATIIGSELRVRANPQALTEIIPEE